jgi:hypothetical protein
MTSGSDLRDNMPFGDDTSLNLRLDDNRRRTKSDTVSKFEINSRVEDRLNVRDR